MTIPLDVASWSFASRRLRGAALALLASASLACGDFAGAAKGEVSGPSDVFDPADAPGGQAAFEQTLYPLLTEYCVSCHAGAGPGFYGH